MWYQEVFSRNLLGPIHLNRLSFRLGIYLIVSLILALACILVFIVSKLCHKTFPRSVLGRCALTAFVFACALDMLSFQQAAYDESPKMPIEHYNWLDSVRVSPLPYQDQRRFLDVSDPVDLSERQLHAISLLNFACHGNRFYAPDYNFIQFDPIGNESLEDRVTGRLEKLVYSRQVSLSVAKSLYAQFKKAQTDHNPDFRTDLIMRGVQKLLKVKRDDISVLSVVGGYYPKLRLVLSGYFVNSQEEANEAAAKLPDIIQTVVLNARKDDPLRSSKTSHTGQSANPGEIKVTDFSANELQADVSVQTPDGAWLVYADAFHPGWQATVNGQKAEVYQAYGAFKAVRLESGRATVRFFFHNGFASVCNHLIALCGLICGCWLLYLFLATLFWPNKTDGVN